MVYLGLCPHVTRRTARARVDVVSFLCFLLALYWLKRPETTGA